MKRACKSDDAVILDIISGMITKVNEITISYATIAWILNNHFKGINDCERCVEA